MLVDNHGRTINYLRLAVTDRCNLRCFYCMPEEGIKYVNRDKLLTYEEMLKMVEVFSDLGVDKVRITGGEPFVRAGIEPFLRKLTQIKALKEVSITTNGTLTADKVNFLEDIGIKSVNLSLDTLNAERFFQITRRNEFATVMKSLEALLQSPIKTKINMVVMAGKNTQDIHEMLELTRENDLDVRFIEEMPFNGSSMNNTQQLWSAEMIKNHISEEFDIDKLENPPFSTSDNYKIKGFTGGFGIIAAYSRTFCGTCNRIRVTPQGDLRTCLYGKSTFNVRETLRNHNANTLKANLINAIGNRAKDGFEAENDRFQQPISESMATIGG